jgi:hypothetical protein
MLLDFGEQGALVSNQHVIYALQSVFRRRFIDYVDRPVGRVRSPWSPASFEPEWSMAKVSFGAALG